MDGIHDVFLARDFAANDNFIRLLLTEAFLAWQSMVRVNF